MVTLADIENYKTELQEAINSGIERFKYNTDRCHNSAIMDLMFSNAAMDGSIPEVNMFCGELSVLREGFYGHIRTENTDICNPDNGNQLSNTLRVNLRESFERFISHKNASFNVIFEDYKESYLWDLICRDAFNEGLANGKIKLYELDRNYSEKYNLAHFSMSKEIVREEQDKELRSAICAINPKDSQKKGDFGILKSVSTPIIVPMSN